MEKLNNTNECKLKNNNKYINDYNDNNNNNLFKNSVNINENKNLIKNYNSNKAVINNSHQNMSNINSEQKLNLKNHNTNTSNSNIISIERNNLQTSSDNIISNNNNNINNNNNNNVIANDNNINNQNSLLTNFNNKNTIHNNPEITNKNQEIQIPNRYSNGIDFDRICGYNPFMKEIFSRVTCSICTLIPYEPLECRNCNAVVCKDCIELWRRKECILKCGGENYDLPSRILRDIINSIVINCKNSHKGCNTNLRIDYMKSHELECDYDEIKCPFTECNVFNIRKEINEHIEKCEYNRIICKYCKLYFKKSLFNSHIENDCEEVLIECEKCQKSDKRKDFFNKHNCIEALKDENKDLQSTICNLVSNLDSLKNENDSLTKQLENETKNFNERKTLMNLMINLLKSNYELDDIKFKSYSYCNPIQIPYIFRFMTSSRTLQITNLADYTFSKISLDIDFDIPTSHQSIVTTSKRIFIVGGVNHEKKTYEFDVLNKTLLEHTDMTVGRRRHILTELRPGIFIATGGSNQNEEVLKDCEAYIISKNTWIKIASLNVARFYHTAFSFKGSYMYVVGGCHTSNTSLVNLNTIERIDLSHELNGSWEYLNVKDISLLKPRSRLSYLFINNDKILLFGGIPDYQAVFFDILKQEIFLADNQYNIEGRFFFNDRCTWQNETLFISSQSSRCIFNHNLNCWELKEFNEDNN